MFKPNYKRLTNTVLLLGIMIISVGCATYQAGAKKAYVEIEKRNYSAAIVELKKNLKTEGDDRLLYFLEIGLLNNLKGEYKASNRLLSRAAQIAEELETIRISDQIGAALTSPRSAAYRGTKFERVFIHYYKALNYAFLAANNASKRESLLEGARIESRKVDILLTALKNEEGTYKDVADKKKGMFSKIMKIFDGLNGDFLDKDLLIYREDAYIRYITGVIYESNGEYDDARISYQQAAELYEKGFQSQYKLENDITEQAWFDVVRMMQWAGGYESDWPKLAETKLSESRRKQLESYKKGSAQLLVIEHVGLIPARDEMNIHLTLDHRSRELVVEPILTGTQQEKNDQMAWFFAMYSEKGVLSLINNYRARGLGGALNGLTSKRFGIGAIWGLAESIGLPKAVGPLGIRVTVPYFRPHQNSYGKSELWIDGKKTGELAIAESLSQLALQEQLLNASNNLKTALARELVKAILAENVAAAAGGGYLSLIAKIANTVTSQADTRNWSMLPQSIKITRLPLPAGKHDVKLLTKVSGRNDIYTQSVHSIELKKGEITILRDRTIKAAAVKHAKAGSASFATIEDRKLSSELVVMAGQ